MTIKKYGIIFILVAAFIALSLNAFTQEKDNKRLRRSDSFLGIHFDFHAGEDCKEIGKNVTPGMVKSILTRVRPDYIQVDCKGHRGLTSYPTKVGNPAPGFIKDPLMIFREVTDEQNVALYCHYSGVLDEEAVKLNPEWAIQGVDGKIGGNDGRVTSVFGPYVDKLLIPQLKELNDIYKVDGVWIDGECWGTERDFQPFVTEKFSKMTGIQIIPKSEKDTGWFEYSQFCRDGFRQYVAHYVDELHKHNPEFQVASNWAYSSFMPEEVRTNVDFLSGDIVPTNSINSARLESRVLAKQGKPWDLMAWSFTINWDDIGGFQSPKSVVQLQQESAEVLSQGGGFQIYFQQDRDASVNLNEMSVMAEVAKFCRARQELCHKSVSVPQIGLILSTDAYYRKIKGLFSAGTNGMNAFRGILQSLLESQHSVDVVMEHQLNEDINRYPLLIYPEWEYINPEFKNKLIAYVENGGKLLIIGPASTRFFQKELGIHPIDSISERVNRLEFNGRWASVKSNSQLINPIENIITFGNLNYNKVNPAIYSSAGSIRKLGKGEIAGVYLNLGERYLNGKVTVARDFLHELVNKIFPDPIVSVMGSHDVDVSLSKINGKLAINLVNSSGPNANSNVYVYDNIPPLGPLQVTIHLNKKPKRVSIHPSGHILKAKYENNLLKVEVPRVEIHEILLIEE
jgi:hypothetical protein